LKRLSMIASALVLSLGSTAAGAQNADPHGAKGRAYVRVSVAHFFFNENAKIKLGGAPVAGGNATVEDNTPPSLEVGYFILPNISVAATIGLPPKTTLRGAGTLSSAGDLGTVTYGPGVYTVRYHLNPNGPIRPYVGAGVNWTIIFDTDDRALQNFKTSNTFGPALVAGVEVPFNQRFSLFGSVSKAWVSTNSRYNLPTPGGLVPGTARVALDPLVVNAGLQVNF
jgi:outer membrane protein